MFSRGRTSFLIGKRVSNERKKRGARRNDKGRGGGKGIIRGLQREKEGRKGQRKDD